MERKESLVDLFLVGGFNGLSAVFVVVLLLMTLVTVVNKKSYKLPPGPWGLPVVGYLPFIGPSPHITFNELRKKYGDVYSITMGSWPAIVISGYDVVNEALATKKDDFAGRPDWTTARLKEDITALGFLPFGPIWKIRRRNITSVLYTFSNTRGNPTETIIQSEAKAVIDEFLSHGNKSFCPLESLDLASFSIIYQLSYNRHENIRGDPFFPGFVKLWKEFSAFNTTGNPVNAMPWLRYFMPHRMTNFVNLLRESKKFREKKIQEHQSSFNEDHLRDIADGFIHAGNRLTEEEKASGVDREQLIGNLNSVVGAGTVTVSSTLQWGVALMVASPHVQEEVFQQIDSVVGQGRDVTLADRAQLPLVEATVYEILRYAGIIPVTPPHFTTRDTTLQGYDVPKGTVVMVNLHSVYMDEKLWGDPKVFRPQRFLDSEGQLDRALVEKSPVFSLGRRRCAGEFLARMELFLLFATLMQRLQFLKPPGHPDFKPKARFTLAADVVPFHVCVKQRA